MKKYIRHHYVPQWYQYRFIPQSQNVKNIYYLSLKPSYSFFNGHKYKNKNLNWWGPSKCFYQDNLYTTNFKDWESTEIEEKFFGEIDTLGSRAVEYFCHFENIRANKEFHHNLLVFMSTQRLRTPKGLGFLAKLTKTQDKNSVLFTLQNLRNIFCAIWTECQWCIVSASQAKTKFIISDNPITTYNQGCFPLSQYCRDFNDPDISFVGTHTLFVLDLNTALILTNKSWLYNPYSNPLKYRPNPTYARDAFFDFSDIQVGRLLTDRDVNRINFIIKSRASQYIAAAEEEWLYPERQIGQMRWDQLGKEYLLMPDPRSAIHSSGPLIRYPNGSVDAFDTYGRKPWQEGYEDKDLSDKEVKTFRAFQGEYARKFGPQRNGWTSRFGDGEKLKIDSPDYHTALLKIPKYKNSK